MTKRVTLNESSTHRSGKVSVTTKAPDLEVELDPEVLIRGTADAGARAIADGIRRISEEASPGTIRQRQRQGISSRKLFNATGTLAAGIVVESTRDGAEVIAPPDRLEDPAMVERLAELVPVLDDPFSDPQVENALERSADEMVKAR